MLSVRARKVAKEKINEAYNAGFKRCIEELEKRAEKDEKIKLEKPYVCEIDLSTCKSKEEVFDKIAKTIAADLLGNKSDNEKEEDNKSDGSQESSDVEQQSEEKQSEDSTKENE